MLPALNQTLRRHSSHAALAALLLSAGVSAAQEVPLADRLIEIDEVSRVTPQRALDQLAELQARVVASSPAERARYLTVSSNIQHKLGKLKEAVALCDQAIVIGTSIHDKDVIASAMLSKAYVTFSLGETAKSHQLIWDAEKFASDTKDVRLRVNALISSGDSYAEDGNFPLALSKLQTAATFARKSGNPLLTVIAMRSLALLYDQMREYDKGFEALDEGIRAAREVSNPEGRLSLLKSAEYALAMDSDQIQRALKAELSALDLQRKLGADHLIGVTLVNLADCYLKLGKYHKALSYAEQALEQARALNNENLAATALVNIGQSYLSMGRIAEGKASMQEGMARYEKTGNKPYLQSALYEYGEALERVGDLAGANEAYRRERTLTNELFEKRRQKAIMELQERYESDKRLREIDLLRRENQVKSTELDNRRLQQRIWWLLILVFGLVATVVGLLYRKVRQANTQLEEKNHLLKQQSSLDPLTTLYNRRHFQEYMRGHGHQAIDRSVDSVKEDTVSALFLLDVDHFKHINDAYGHGAGDAVLREVAGALREILRETDMIVRWGGEEFLAFLPAVPRGSLEEVARRLLEGIAERTVDYHGNILSVRVSIGYAPFPLTPSSAPSSWEHAVNIVDMALYMAKSHGRNRAYGVRSIAPGAEPDIEQDIEKAWRSGKVDICVVVGQQTPLRAVH
jgi:diguanylate cyclase (GGDEF)-like protein